MKTVRLSLCAVWLGMSVVVHAADDVGASLNVLVERTRIIQQRVQFEAIFEKKQQGCYERFAVSDCLRQARRERRMALDELRHQEVILNDLERQSAAAAELNRIQDNLSPERQKELDLQRQQALTETLERQARSNEKKEVSVRPADVAVSAVRSALPASGSDNALNQQRRYSDKLHEAQQRKTDKAESLIEKEGNKAKPLPIPAGY